MPFSPWSVRSTAPGVLNAFNWGDWTQASINAYTKFSDPSPQFPAEEGGKVYPRRDTTFLNTSGHPTMRFDWPAAPCYESSFGNGPRGKWMHPLVNDVRTDFNDSAFKLGPGRELWAQWQVWLDPVWAPADGRTLYTSNRGGMKFFCVDFGAGGMYSPHLFVTNFESEIMIQDNANRRLHQGYNGNSMDYWHPPGVTIKHGSRGFEVSEAFTGYDIQFQNVLDCRYTRDNAIATPPPSVPGPTYSGVPIYNEPPCRHFRPGWNVMKMHVVIGPKLYFFSDGDYRFPGQIELWIGAPGEVPTKCISMDWSWCWDFNDQQGATWPDFYTDTYNPARGGYLCARPQTTTITTAGQTSVPYNFKIDHPADVRVDLDNPNGPQGPYDYYAWTTNAFGCYGGPIGSIKWDDYQVLGAGNPGGGTVVFTGALAGGLPAGTRVDVTKLRLWEKFIIFPYDYTHNCNPPGGPPFIPSGVLPPAWAEPVYQGHPAFKFYYADIILSTNDIDDVLDEGGAEVIVPTPGQLVFANNPIVFG